MKRILLFTYTFIISLYVCAQVTVDVKIDSLQLLIGEQTGITLDVCCDSKQNVQFPNYQPGQALTENIEVVNISPIDTSMLDNGKRMQLSRKYIICAWDSSFYYLPPLEVVVGGKKYMTKSLALKVQTIDVDTIHVDRFYGPKAEMDAPFAWADWRLVVILSFVVILLNICSIFLFVMLKTGKPLMQIVKRKKKEPAHTVAIREIEKIKVDRKWAEDDSKEYYTRLTETLRTYIQERYKFNAMDMTSDEIIERLMQENDKEALEELRGLFTTADLVKFAKFTTLINENDANLVTALQYINQTKLEVDPNQKAEETIITPDQKKQKETIFRLRFSIAILVTVSLVLFAMVVWHLVDLLY